MSGTVKGSIVDPDGNIMANCQLFMYRRTDGTLLGSAVSDDYELTHTAENSEEVFMVCLDNDDSPDFEGIVRDRIAIVATAAVIGSIEIHGRTPEGDKLLVSYNDGTTKTLGVYALDSNNQIDLDSNLITVDVSASGNNYFFYPKMSDDGTAIAYFWSEDNGETCNPRVLTQEAESLEYTKIATISDPVDYRSEALDGSIFDISFGGSYLGCVDLNNGDTKIFSKTSSELYTLVSTFNLAFVAGFKFSPDTSGNFAAIIAPTDLTVYNIAGEQLGSLSYANPANAPSTSLQPPIWLSSNIIVRNIDKYDSDWSFLGGACQVGDISSGELQQVSLYEDLITAGSMSYSNFAGKCLLSSNTVLSFNSETGAFESEAMISSNAINGTLVLKPDGETVLYNESTDVLIHSLVGLIQIRTQSQSQEMIAGTYSLSFEITENNSTTTVTATYTSTENLTLSILTLYLMAQVDLGYWTDVTSTYIQFTGLFSFADVNNYSTFRGLDSTYLNGITTPRPMLVKLIQTDNPVGTDIYDYIFGENYKSLPVRTEGYSLIAGLVK